MESKAVLCPLLLIDFLLLCLFSENIAVEFEHILKVWENPAFLLWFTARLLQVGADFALM
jgi:hypothetical protein